MKLTTKDLEKLCMFSCADGYAVFMNDEEVFLSETSKEEMEDAEEIDRYSFTFLNDPYGICMWAADYLEENWTVKKLSNVNWRKSTPSNVKKTR